MSGAACRAGSGREADHEAGAGAGVGAALETRRCSEAGTCSLFALAFRDRPVEPERALPRLAPSSPPALGWHSGGFTGPRRSCKAGACALRH